MSTSLCRNKAFLCLYANMQILSFQIIFYLKCSSEFSSFPIVNLSFLGGLGETEKKMALKK